MIIIFQASIWTFLGEFLKITSENTPTIVSLVTFGVLYQKMTVGFKNVTHHLENHDRDIKQIKRKLKLQKEKLEELLVKR